MKWSVDHEQGSSSRKRTPFSHDRVVVPPNCSLPTSPKLVLAGAGQRLGVSGIGGVGDLLCGLRAANHRIIGDCWQDPVAEIWVLGIGRGRYFPKPKNLPKLQERIDFGTLNKR